MRNDWFSYIRHAAVAAPMGHSRSKYKGGFVNGKNTSEYNHDYYIHNKEKWGNPNGGVLQGANAEDLTIDQYKQLLAKAKAEIEARTGREWNPEDSDEFWTTMGEEYGINYSEDERVNQAIYNQVMGNTSSKPHGRQRGETTASGDVHKREQANTGKYGVGPNTPKKPKVPTQYLANTPRPTTSTISIIRSGSSGNDTDEDKPRTPHFMGPNANKKRRRWKAQQAKKERERKANSYGVR